VGVRTNDLYDQGFVLIWGKNSVVNKEIAEPLYAGQASSLGDSWWNGDQQGWYTAVYPWNDPDGWGPGTLVEEMSDFRAVQRLLDRCCDDIALLTEATDLVCRPDGSCERTWLVNVARGKARVSVTATIKPVTFLDRLIMDIDIKVAKASAQPGFLDGVD
jgi:hypothetical protein